MSPSPRNVELDAAFAERLVAAREAKRLSRAELAERAQLSYRTVLNLESGRRLRVQEKTLMLLAQALDVSFGDLLGRTNGDSLGPAAPLTLDRRRPRRTVFIWLAAVLLVAAALWAVRLARVNARWTVEASRLVARDGILGLELWRLDTHPNLLRCNLSPWSSRVLLVSASGRTADGGWLRALDRATGKVLWEVRPDVEAAVRAFGAETVLAAGFNCYDPVVVDFAGDGEPEILLRFIHGKYYPTCLCVVDRHGHRLSQYVNKGHIYDVVPYDLDGDGKQEVVLAGTNNSPAYQGATLLILDEDHRHGASIDAQTDAWSQAPDSALVRVVLPLYPPPFAGHMSQVRLAAERIQVFRGNGGSLMISAEIGPTVDERLIVTFDAHLRPVSSEIVDAFLKRIQSTWPAELWHDTGPTDPAWRADWLATHHRFEAGHWPPGTTLATP